jgi:hypothetical protein
VKTMLRSVCCGEDVYQALMFICPGCAETHTGLHMLPVSGVTERPMWTFDGNLEAPTLSPSILTRHGDMLVCHSFLRNGVFEFLGDSTHSLAGQHVPMPDLPDWASR